MGPKPDCMQSGKTFRLLKVSLRHQRRCKPRAEANLFDYAEAQPSKLWAPVYIDLHPGKGLYLYIYFTFSVL